MFVATLIATGSLRHEHIASARDAIAGTGAVPGETVWLEEGVAADIGFSGDMVPVHAAIAALGLPVDFAVQPVATREKKLLVADMDSTMITIECIDELADYAGIKAQIAEVTERAMRGELDFSAALTERVALLKGLDDSVIDTCRAERVKLTPGAKTLIRTLKSRGAHSVLVSGGFTRFAEPVAEEIGFDRAIANVLGIADGKLTGTVEFPIVDAERKRTELVAHAEKLGIDLHETMAIGDGANDIPMIVESGFGIAYHAKEKARAAADAAISHGDLTAVLYMLGIPKAQWVEG
ncbi:MAG TPA: phosphoserine phosphatase SerB [Sphingobium sp.]|uniref:phosphoserine phosphatase SerB n=1 Tax=Sphingobium sp. TaxID=1912891 RepID=UPI002ED42496